MVKGAYLIHNVEQEKIFLFIFKKLPPDELQDALPLEKVPEGNDFICAFFADGQDYIGSDTLGGVHLVLGSNKSVDLLGNSYENCKEIIPCLNEEEYRNNLQFAIEQLT